MDGKEFYKFLKDHYTKNGQQLYVHFTFNSWLEKKDAPDSFKFKGKTQLKSIPASWLIDAKNAQNSGEDINREWFNKYYGKKSYNDCRASIAMFLLRTHNLT